MGRHDDPVGLFSLASQRLAEIAGVGPEDSVLKVSYSEQGWAERLPFQDGQFDAVLCPMPAFWLADIPLALTEWKRVTRAGGKIAFSTFGEGAFQPLASWLDECTRRLGLCAPGARPFAWQALADPELCRQVLRDIELQNIIVQMEQFEYPFASAEEWWDFAWEGGLQQLVSMLSPDQKRQFQTECLAEASAWSRPNGIALHVVAIFALGKKAGPFADRRVDQQRSP